VFGEAPKQPTTGFQFVSTMPLGRRPIDLPVTSGAGPTDVVGIPPRRRAQ
jgi:hypothetical protein